MLPEFFAKTSLKTYIGGICVPYHPWLPDMNQISDTLLLNISMQF